MKRNLAIIFGSRSTEHDISILTASQVMNAVDRQKFNLIPIYISNDGKWYSGSKLLDLKFYANFNSKKVKQVAILPSSNFLYAKKIVGYKPVHKIDCAIIACHGKNGEDGTVQGLLELSQIPYQSSCVAGSCVGLDKSLMKQLFLQNKIPITEYATITKLQFEGEEFDLDDALGGLSFPVIAKPNKLGSSIGISVCKTKEDLLEAIRLAFVFDDKVIVEQYIENLQEVNISVLGDGENSIVSVTEEVQNKGLLTFDKKYLSSQTSKASKVQKTKKDENSNAVKCGMQNMGRIIPANITESQNEQIEKLAKKVFECTYSKGVVRIDFMIDKSTGKVFANEINTIPGSFAFYLWEKSGISFCDLIDRLVEIACTHQKAESKLTTTFLSSVLSQNQIKTK